MYIYLQVVREGRNVEACPAPQPLEQRCALAALLHVVDESHHQTTTAEASCATCALHVALRRRAVVTVLALSWKLEIDHHGHALHVDSSATCVGRDEDTRAGLVGVLEARQLRRIRAARRVRVEALPQKLELVARFDKDHV